MFSGAPSRLFAPRVRPAAAASLFVKEVLDEALEEILRLTRATFQDW
jgi:hypothetical protein